MAIDRYGMMGWPPYALLLRGLTPPAQVGKSRRIADILHLVTTATSAIPVIDRVDMVGALVAPVGDIESAVRPHETIHGAKTIVVADQEIPAEVRGEA